MKFRSFLLFACMVVVPSLAMFSHRIPPSLRKTALERLWNPLTSRVAKALEADAVSAAPALTATATAQEFQPMLRPQPLPSGEPATIATPKPASAPTQIFQSVASEKSSVELRLAELGAFAFDCAPLADSGGLHRCSCRVAADSSGQLQRVFQAADRDPIAAMKNLVGQVQSWRERLAAAPSSGDAPLSGMPGRALRF